jgi:hypothetical protein
MAQKLGQKLGRREVLLGRLPRKKASTRKQGRQGCQTINRFALAELAHRTTKLFSH